jgi:hypothetical protein
MCGTTPGTRRVAQKRIDVMNTQTIAMIAAGLGVGFSVAYVALGIIGIRMLRHMRNRVD